MIFADAMDDGAVPEFAVTAVSSVEAVNKDHVRVSYYAVVPREGGGSSANRVVVRLTWNAAAWLGMAGVFERARAMIALRRGGDGGAAAAAREAQRQEGIALAKRVAGPALSGETVKARIIRTAELLGWDVRRTEDIWRGEARRIEAYEMDQLRASASDE